MKSFLKVNLSQFDGGDEDLDAYFDETGNFDEDAFDKAFEEETKDDTPDEPDVPEDETPPEDHAEDEPDEVDNPEDAEGEDGQTNEQTFPEPKQNQAFAEMRKRAEENEKYAKFLQDLAAQNGLSDPEQLISAYEERQLQNQAKEQNVPVEFLKENQELKSRLDDIEQQSTAERVNRDIHATVEKHNLSEDDVNSTIQYMVDNNLFNEDRTPSIGFEQAYKLANMDTMVERAKQEARQEYLESQKQKQDTSTIDSGGGSSVPKDNVPSEEEMLAQMKADGFID